MQRDEAIFPELNILLVMTFAKSSQKTQANT